MQVFTSLLVLSIVFIVFIISDINNYKQRRVRNILSLAQIVGNNSIPTLQFQDNEAAKQILSELHNVIPEIVHATILDKNNKAFASYTKPGADSLVMPATLAEEGFAFAGRKLVAESPIVDNGNQAIGKVVIAIELSELEQIRQSKYKLATLLLFMAIGFSLLIAILVQRYISRRLLLLVNRMKEVNETGDYNDPITDNGKDEISTLIKVYNDMLLRIKESQQRKDEFIGIASHELKTPLTSIKGYVELLNLIEEKQPNKQYIQKTLDNIKKLERLIKDLLDVSKIQSGQLELNMQEFNVNDLLHETIVSFQMIASGHKIIKEDALANETVIADRQRIEQVLINLLSNAIKYSPGESRVIVRSRMTDKELIIQIRDFGIGIPKEEQASIFERFYRTKDTSIHISGFGLGLYICRDIINRHEGRIWIETEDRGSAFYFSLPLKTNGNK